MNAGPTSAVRRLALSISASLLFVTAVFGQNAEEQLAPVEIVNIASASFRGPEAENGADSEPIEMSTNGVTTIVEIAPPRLTFHDDPSMSTEPLAVDTGDDLWMRVLAPGCQHDLAVREVLDITIRSLTSGDEEHYLAHETVPDSGVFDSVEPVMTGRVNGPVIPANKLLELWGEDELWAEVRGCGGVAVDTVLIDPDGVVFDSLTNAPLAGAHVRLIDVTGAGNGGHPGELADVFHFDGVTEHTSEILTGADGRFQFPMVAASEYRLDVTPPPGYSGPSRLPIELLPAGRTINDPGSHLGIFHVNLQTGAVTLDVPLDPTPQGIAVEKRALRTTAEIGETVGYTLELRNLSNFPLRDAVLRDDLPAGFSFVAGSARLGGERIADPAGGAGPALTFTFDSLPAGSTSTLTYRVAIGPGALQGDGINRARLTSEFPSPQASNLATAKVEVQGGVFDDRAYVLGRVIADCNRDGSFGAGEAGLPRVRLYLEDGSYVITDGEGKFSFYGVIPRTHVLKVDATTLPEGVKLAAISHRHAGRGDSRFLDVKRGELHRADFATDGCPPVLNALLAAGRAGSQSNELDGVKNALRLDDSIGDVRAQAASGVIGGVNNAAPVRVASLLPAQAALTTGRRDLRDLMPTLESWLGFVDLHDGSEVGTTELTLRVKGRTATQIRVSVNGTDVGDDHIGLKLEDPVRHVQALEYVGVTLAPGTNTITLMQADTAGHFRETVSANVIAPGVVARVKITPPAAGIPADGEHAGQVRVNVQDEAGVRVTSRTPVTLETTGGEWTTPDLDPAQPGLQVFIAGGEASFGLRSRNTGSVRVRATTADFEHEAEVSFVSALRPLIGVGVLEGTFSLEKLDRGALLSARHDDGFERELRSFGRDGESGGARAALFLKGKVRGDYLLTLGYDSDKDTRDRLFRDIQPDRFYPVYGDSSIKGYDAQTTGRLYVRVERNKSSFTGGDLTTQSLTRARMMGAYNRSLTGVKQHFETDHVAIEAFASRDSTRQVVDEFPANGTSGPYTLSGANALENSELVEILTRDRDQPSVIIASVAKRRFVDYDFEPFTGRLLFRAPIPSVTADLDPVSIRVTYEVEQGGEEFTTAGVDSLFKIGSRVEFGVSHVDDQNPEDTRQVSGVNGTVRFGKATTLVTEAARTESMNSDGDLGARFELRHEGTCLNLRAFASHTDEAFDNPSAGYTANRDERGIKAGFSVSDRTRLNAEVLSTTDATSGVGREGAMLGVERSFAGNYKAEVGVRQVRDADDSDDETTSARARFTAPLGFARDASVFAEYEQDLADADARVAALGGDYRLGTRARFYARHEFISSLTGPYDLDPAQKRNSTVIGVDSTYWQDDAIFSEYRIGDSLTGREAQAAIGLRNTWSVAEGVRLNTSLERLDAIGSTSGTESTAATAAIEYLRNPLWKSTARIELRNASGSDSGLLTLGTARKLTSDWTMLARGLWSIIDNDTGDDRAMQRLQAGLAYRDGENRVNSLMRYEFKSEDGVETGLDRRAHIVSLHGDLQQTARLKFNGQLAAKWVEEQYESTHKSSATLIATGVTYDLARRWDIGAHVRGLFDDDFSGVQGGVGAEVGFLLTQNLWLSAGYNVLGFRDDDLAGNEYTRRGAYLRVRFKFDETVLP